MRRISVYSIKTETESQSITSASNMQVTVKFFTPLHMSTNDCKSTSIDLSYK